MLIEASCGDERPGSRIINAGLFQEAYDPGVVEYGVARSQPGLEICHFDPVLTYWNVVLGRVPERLNVAIEVSICGAPLMGVYCAGSCRYSLLAGALVIGLPPIVGNTAIVAVVVVVPLARITTGWAYAPSDGPSGPVVLHNRSSGKNQISTIWGSGGGIDSCIGAWMRQVPRFRANIVICGSIYPLGVSYWAVVRYMFPNSAGREC